LQQLNGENAGKNIYKMATVNYIIKGKTETIYLRFRHKEIDISTSTQLYVNPAHWDKKYQKIKNTLQVPNRDQINELLALLKIGVISKFNEDFSTGTHIDKDWLEKVILNHYKRPQKESEHATYLSDFVKFWMDHKAAKHKTPSGEYLTDRAISQYEQTLENLINFEKYAKKKIKLAETTSEFMDEFSIYLTDVEQYAESTARRKLKRVKFFCDRAIEENLNVNNGYKARVFVRKEEEEYKHPYLNEAEIEQVFNFQTEDYYLEITKDNWIIGLWTGLRVSDFLTRLNPNNIKGDFIEIKTLKTKTLVAIPTHWQVKSIIQKYNGNLPPKISEVKFNKNIKKISKELGFNIKMIGGISKVDPETGIKRKVIGEFEKWELITSHICRRSFCTNLLGKVPNNVIMDVAGWSNEAQMFAYNKQTNLESAIALKKYWERP
jgi:site-specific recombinase XerD